MNKSKNPHHQRKAEDDDSNFEYDGKFHFTDGSGATRYPSHGAPSHGPRGSHHVHREHEQERHRYTYGPDRGDEEEEDNRAFFTNPPEPEVDPNKQLFMDLIRSMRTKMPMPTFKGSAKQDPLAFRRKAEDYLTSINVPHKEWTAEFKYCLEGKARLWYEESFTARLTWEALMTLFTERFCVYGTKQEDWYRAWSELRFDPSSDSDIEDFLTDVKALKNLLNFPDSAVLASLKNLFPQHRLYLIQVTELPKMYAILRDMFPKNRTSTAPQSSGNPFALHGTAAKGEAFFETPKDHVGCGNVSQNNSLEEAVSKISTCFSQMAVRDSAKTTSPNHDRPPQRPRRPQPYKPSVTRALRSHSPGRQQVNRFRRFGNNRGRFNSTRPRDRFQGRGRDQNRFRRFDRSPRGRKPRENSKTPNQDRGRCFKCHQFGHLARYCRSGNNRQYSNEGNYQGRRPFPTSGQYVHFDDNVYVHRYPPSSPPDQRLHDYGARNAIHTENYLQDHRQEETYLRYPELNLRESQDEWDNSARLAVIHGSEELN